MTESLEIVYQKDQVVAINKPHGLMVHKSKIAGNTSEFALQILRDQLGSRVYPIHRLDRKTGGVLLFALEAETHKKLQFLFAEGDVSKEYFAIVRGYTEDSGEIDYPLAKPNGTVQQAYSTYHTLSRAELGVPFGKHKTSRYSLVSVSPKTGRIHQIRKHLAHIDHPIIGDRPHGCNKQNKLFKEKWEMTTMMLHAFRLSFKHPDSGAEVEIIANPQDEFMRVVKLMG